MNPVRTLALTAIVASSLACGSSKPTEVPMSARPAQRPLEQEQPLTPVEAPADLIVVGRIQSPSRVFDTGTRWVGFPFDWRTLLAKELPGVDRVIVLDAPVDMAVMLDPTAGIEPRVHFAFSIGVTSMDRALSFFRQRGELVGHRTPRIRLGANLSCVVQRAFGAAPARLVCGGDEESVDALAPYMARGLPRQTFGNADLHVHFDAKPIRSRFGAQLTLLKTAGVPFVMKELAMDHPAFDRALRDVLYGAVEEVIDVIGDLDRAAFDVTVDGERDLVNAAASMRFIGQKSWSAGTIVAASARSAPPPDVFWALPKDSIAASYSAYSDPKRIEKAVNALGTLLGGWLEYMAVPEKQRRPVVDAFQGALLNYGPSIYAELPPPPLSENEADEARRAREQLRHAIGQHIMGIEGDAAPYKVLLTSMTATFSDRAFRARLEKEKMFEGMPLPILRERRAKIPKGLPAGAAVFEVEFPAQAFSKKPTSPAVKKEKASVEALRALIVVVPDGRRTFILAGTDEAALVGRFAAVRAAVPAESLASVSGLESLRSAKAVSGGYVTVASVIAGLNSPLDEPSTLGSAHQRQLQFGKLTSAMPHRGLVPIPYVLTADANGPTATASMQVPKLVIQDIAAAAAAGLAQLSF